MRRTEDFRRAAWLEASLSGIEVNEYKPSNVEKAHLKALLDRNAPENSVERGTDRQQSPALERSGTDAAKQQQEPPNTSSANPPWGTVRIPS